MKWIEHSWYRPFGITWLFLPLSLIFLIIVKYRFYFTRKKQSVSAHPKIIVVGNISVGGTGKTPFTLFLAEYLLNKGCKVAVISRGYGGETQLKPLLVTADTAANVVGDEPKLIQSRLGIPVVVCPDRNSSINFLKDNADIDVIIADDGLQHYKMERTLEWCIVDGKRKHGNGLVLPAGPLREPKSRLKHVDLVIQNGGQSSLHYILGVDGLYSVKSGQKITSNPNQVTLVSAIGNPQRFEQSVTSLSIDVLDHITYPDHYNYQEPDFSQLTGDVVMTEKDAVKCKQFAKENWYYLKVSAQPSPQLIQNINSQLKEKGILHGV